MVDVLSLCDHSGVWSEPWVQAGFDVQRIDLQAGTDVRTLPFIRQAPRVILAAPPCDHFANSGARWWAGKGEKALHEGLALVDACLRLVAIYRPAVWALENPCGRLSRFIGKPAHTFNPSDYGDPYTKRTCLWGEFTMPQKNPVAATEGSKMHFLGQSKQRKNVRSKTPEGFAREFFLANRHFGSISQRLKAAGYPSMHRKLANDGGCSERATGENK